MRSPITIRPTNSEAFEIGDKVATIVLEGDQLVIGDPCYGIEDKYAEYPFDPSTVPPVVTGYRVIKKSGAYYEVDNLEEAEALVKRQEGEDGELEIAPFEHQPIPLQSAYIRVTLPTSVARIDVFEVKQVVDSDEFFGHYFQVKAPINPDTGCETHFIESAPVDSGTIMFGSLPASETLTIEAEDGFHYQGRRVSGFSEEAFPLIFSDEEKARGIVLKLPLGDGFYPIESVLEMDEEEPLLGVLFVPVPQ
jgi:hypothetical protein